MRKFKAVISDLMRVSRGMGIFLGRYRNDSGFTLIEILISVGILAFMSLLMGATMNSVFEAKNIAAKRSETMHSITVAIMKMQNDFSLAFVTGKEFMGADSSFMNGMIGTEQQVVFSTLSHVHFIKDNKDTDQVIVGYYLKPDDRGLQTLFRSETDTLQPNLDKAAQQGFPLLKNVKSFEIKYYDANKKTDVPLWDTASVSSAGRLPAIVKIKLAVEMRVDDESLDEAPIYEFKTDIRVLMSKKIIF